MPVVIRALPVAALLALPTVLAFYSGGYFDRPRLVAGIVVWLLVGLAAAVATVVAPRSRPGRLTALGLGLLTLLVGLSILWAPVPDFAQNDLQRLVLYLGALLAAVAFLRGAVGTWVTEPVLGGGVLVVIGYALLGRLLPGIVEQTQSSTAFGRLEQPLTYWNAVGVLAALGVLLAVRVAGDRRRPEWLRCAGAAAAVPLGVGVYLTFSRGALLALAVGLVLLVVLSRERAQLGAAVVSIAGAVFACAAAGLLPAVRTGGGAMHARELEGLAAGAVLVVLMVVVAFAMRRVVRRPEGEPIRAPGLLAGGLVVLLVAGFVFAASGSGDEHGQPRIGADTRRLASFESNRYEYWKVAGNMFLDNPVLGAGSGSFRVIWRRDRPIDDSAVDAHSLYVETAGELGLLGLLALALFVGGAAWTCVRAVRADRQGALGAVAVLAALAVHAGLDWDWEMPAVSLVGLLLLGALIATVDDAEIAAAA